MNAHKVATVLSQKLTVLDGGLATSLEDRGHDLSGALWSARMLRDNPAELLAVNLDHANAGAQIISTASYQVSRRGFVANGLTAADADAALVASVEISRGAAEQASAATGRDVLVAASLGPFGAILADGSEYRGDYTISRQELLEFHAERLSVLRGTEPDLLAFETVPSAMEIDVINELLSTDFSSTPAWISCSAQTGDSISDGTSAAHALAAVTAEAVVAIGFNCIKPELAQPLLTSISTVRPDLHRIVYSNAGRTWDALNRTWLDEGADHIDASALKQWHEAGATIIGGCCGLGPAQVRAVARFAATRGNKSV
ncbi:MAG: hypothetical protein RL441_1633 [Actinomycetota bacterium]